MSWLNRLANLLRRRDLTSEIDEEFQFHLEATIEENQSRGMSPAFLKRVMVVAAMRMQTEGERGDEAFHRIALEEVREANGERSFLRRSEPAGLTLLNGGRLGFTVDE